MRKMPTLEVNLSTKVMKDSIFNNETAFDAESLTDLISEKMFSMDWKIIIHNDSNKIVLKSDTIMMIEQIGKFITLYLSNGKTIVIDLERGIVELQ